MYVCLEGKKGSFPRRGGKYFTDTEEHSRGGVAGGLCWNRVCMSRN